MFKTKIRKFVYRLRHKYLTLNNVVIVVAFLIAANWVWGSLGMMQRNYALQREVDNKQRQLQLTELQKDSLELQKRYFQTDEFKELAVRESLGLVRPGEKTLILPSNTVSAADQAANTTTTTAAPVSTASNVEQWLNFLFGGNSKSASN